MVHTCPDHGVYQEKLLGNSMCTTSRVRRASKLCLPATREGFRVGLNEKIPGVKWVAATTSPSTPASSGAVLSVSANTYNLAGLWSEGHIHRRVGTCGGEAKELSVKI